MIQEVIPPSSQTSLGNFLGEGFFDVEEVGIFGKIASCAKTTLFVVLYLKINTITTTIMDLFKDDVKDDMKLPFEVGELLQTAMLPSVSANIVMTIITLVRSKRYNALNFFLGNGAVAFGIYRATTKYGLISTIKEAL